MRLSESVIALSMLASLAHGQSQCDERGCVYDFSVPADGAIPDWQERTPPGLNHLSVADGVGVINVVANGGVHYVNNNAHVTWTYAGGGFSEAEATLGFADSGRPGWIEKFSDGTRYFSLCRPETVATRASDELMLLTLYDDGESFVGGFIGGDTNPLGVSLIYDPYAWPPSHEWRGFAVMGVVQKLAGEVLPHVLKVTIGEPIRMGAQGLHLSVSVRQRDGEWYVRAVADKEGGNQTYEAEAKLDDAPSLDGGVGLNGIVLPKPYFCIYREGGEINRRIEVSRVMAWNR